MDINYVAIGLSAVSSMVVGALWFQPKVFGNVKQTLTGVDGNEPSNPAATYIGAFAAAIVTALTLNIAIEAATPWWEDARLALSLLAAATLWAGFTAATSAVHYLFEGRPAKLFVINVSHQLITVLVMALILGTVTI